MLKRPCKVVVCGSGVIGVSTAYYLSLRGANVTCIDEVGPAAAASGKAGGFLARSWCAGAETDLLQQFSFDLHAQIAKAVGAETIDYRKTNAFSVTCSNKTITGGSLNTRKKGETTQTKSENTQKKTENTRKKNENSPTWLNGVASVLETSRLGTTLDCAQVHPKKFVDKLAELCTNNGVVFAYGSKVTRVLLDNTGHTTGVQLESGDVIDADKVVIALGPWSSSGSLSFGGDVEAAAKVPKLPECAGLLAHSVVIKSQGLPAESLFTNFDGHDPELYPRGDDTVYVCGCADDEVWDTTMTMKASEVGNNVDKCATLTTWAKALSTNLHEVVAQQSCHLPMMHDGNPVIGFLGGTSNSVVVAYGHSCWGICQGPGTGLVVSELLLDGKAKAVNVDRLSPNRFL